jgi:hypothetical protein
MRRRRSSGWVCHGIRTQPAPVSGVCLWRGHWRPAPRRPPPRARARSTRARLGVGGEHVAVDGPDDHARSEGLFSHGPVHAAADPVRKGFVHDIGRFPVVSYATEYREFATESQPVARPGARPVPFAPRTCYAAGENGRVRLQRRAGEMVEIRLRNSMTRRVERLEPIDPENVRMYVCGPTVYDRAHLGNARPVVVFDVLYRLLKHVYGAGPRDLCAQHHRCGGQDHRPRRRAAASRSTS